MGPPQFEPDPQGDNFNHVAKLLINYVYKLKYFSLIVWKSI